MLDPRKELFEQLLERLLEKTGTVFSQSERGSEKVFIGRMTDRAFKEFQKLSQMKLKNKEELEQLERDFRRELLEKSIKYQSQEKDQHQKAWNLVYEDFALDPEGDYTSSLIDQKIYENVSEI